MTALPHRHRDASFGDDTTNKLTQEMPLSMSIKPPSATHAESRKAAGAAQDKTTVQDKTDSQDTAAPSSIAVGITALFKGLEKTLTLLMVLALVAMIVLVFVNVVLRYGFSTSILGGNEFVTIAFIFTSAIGGAVGITRREHIAITFFIDLLPRPIKMFFYILGLALIAIVNGALIYYTTGWIEKAGHFPWQPFNMPQGLVHAAIPIGCGLAIIFCIIKIILTLAGREQIDILWMPED